MGIKISDIAVGYEYQTATNQDRAVLGYDKTGRVVYASRGGNVKNPYKERHACKTTTFARACSQKGRKIKKTELDKIVKDTSASAVLV